MRVERLPEGRLRIPWRETYEAEGGVVISVDGTREIEPGDPDYARWAVVAEGAPGPVEGAP